MEGWDGDGGTMQPRSIAPAAAPCCHTIGISGWSCTLRQCCSKDKGSKSSSTGNGAVTHSPCIFFFQGEKIFLLLPYSPRIWQVPKAKGSAFRRNPHLKYGIHERCHVVFFRNQTVRTPTAFPHHVRLDHHTAPAQVPLQTLPSMFLITGHWTVAHGALCLMHKWSCLQQWVDDISVWQTRKSFRDPIKCKVLCEFRLAAHWTQRAAACCWELMAEQQAWTWPLARGAPTSSPLVPQYLHVSIQSFCWSLMGYSQRDGYNEIYCHAKMRSICMHLLKASLEVLQAQASSFVFQLMHLV